jgi:hypothetical protein
VETISFSCRLPILCKAARTELDRSAGDQFDAELERLFVAQLRKLPNPLLNASPADTRAWMRAAAS